MSEKMGILEDNDLLTELRSRYKIETIAKSAVNFILKCMDSDGTRVCKVFPRKQKQPENQIQEYKILEKLSSGRKSEFIVQLHENLYQNDHFYAFFLTYYPKGDLLDMLQSNDEIIQTKRTNWISSLAQAIKFIHSNTVCHLDISLENCLLDENYNLRLADFGQAKTFSPNELIPATFRFGKRGYRSPEIHSQEDFYGDKADVWSFGICMFIILVGCPPYYVPCKKDKRFALIYNGMEDSLCRLLSRWGRMDKMDSTCRSVLSQIFQEQTYRPTMQQIIDDATGEGLLLPGKQLIEDTTGKRA